MSICLVLADSAHARLYETDAGIHSTSLIESMEHPETGSYAREIFSDQEGLGLASSRELAKEAGAHFAREIATRLEDFYESHRYERFILAAPPVFLGLLRQQLDERLRRAVVAELVHDWIKTPEDELGAALRHGLGVSAPPA